MIEDIKSSESKVQEKIKEEVQVVKYPRENGLVMVSYGEQIKLKPSAKESEEKYFLVRPIKDAIFILKDGQEIDLIRLLSIPDDWEILEAPEEVNFVSTFPEEKFILISSIEEIAFEESVKPKDIFAKTKEIQNVYGKEGLRFAYSQNLNRLQAIRKVPFFSSYLGIFILAHETNHAKKVYSQEEIERRGEIRAKKREEMNEKDIDDYANLVIEDEYQANRQAIKTILELRKKGIDLVPKANLQELEDISYQALWSYEQKLYPAIPRLKALIERFKNVAVRLLELKEEQISSNRIYQYLKERKLHQPSFKFLYGRKAKDWLIKRGLVNNLQSAPDAILIFNLPKPLAHWWYKGAGKEWVTQGIPAQGAPNLWGEMYEEMMPKMWKLKNIIDGFEEDIFCFDPIIQKELRKLSQGFKEFNGLGLRINEPGEHDPKNYYYVWGWWLSEQKKDQI